MDVSTGAEPVAAGIDDEVLTAHPCRNVLAVREQLRRQAVGRAVQRKALSQRDTGSGPDAKPSPPHGCYANERIFLHANAGLGLQHTDGVLEQRQTRRLITANKEQASQVHLARVSRPRAGPSADDGVHALAFCRDQIASRGDFAVFAECCSRRQSRVQPMVLMASSSPPVWPRERLPRELLAPHCKKRRARLTLSLRSSPICLWRPVARW